MNYTWVDTVKQGEARARFTVADLRRNQPGNAETFSPTPHIATIRLVESKALDRKWPIFGGDVTCAYPHAPEYENEFREVPT